MQAILRAHTASCTTRAFCSMPPLPARPDALAQPLLALMDASEQGFALFDQSDRLLYANAVFRRWMGLHDDELPTWEELMRLGHARRQGTQIDSQDFELWLASARSRRGKLPYRLLESDSTVGRWTLIAETTLQDGGMLCVLTDITDLSTDQRRLRQQRDKARKAALTDELTGLSNRRYLMERLEQLVPHEPGLAVALIDLDHFKRVNDVHGHAAGDQVLRQFGLVLLQHTRRNDVSGRLGGEEFLLVLRGASRPLAARRVRALLEAVRDNVPHPDWPAQHCTASAGLAFARPGDTTRSLMTRADGLLYAAKADGRNHCMVETEDGQGLRATVFAAL
jgi:diguanylate cyclase (GGDEF)-like protein